MATQIAKHVKVLQQIKAHTRDVTCVEFYGNNLLISGSWYVQSIVLTWICVRVLTWYFVNLLHLSSRFYSQSDKTIRVWRWNVGCGFLEESFSPLLGHRYGVTSVKVSPQVRFCAKQKKQTWNQCSKFQFYFGSGYLPFPFSSQIIYKNISRYSLDVGNCSSSSRNLCDHLFRSATNFTSS